jgi:hypothetical protein
MADSEPHPRIEEWRQRHGEWGTCFGYSNEIRWEFHARGDWRGIGGLSMSDRSSPPSKTILVYSHDHAALQLIRDFLEPLGFTVEVAPASGVNSVADPS